MPRVRDLLYRFRPAGVPGAATAAGVPTDRVADLTAELAPVFAALEATEEECTTLVADAEREAATRRERDQGRARAAVESARAKAPAERAEVIAHLRADSDHASRDALERARRDAELVATASSARAPAYAEDVVARVRALLETAPGQPRGADP